MNLHLDLIQLCRLEGLPRPVPEYRFCKRKWRIDYAFVQEKLAVEIDGGAWINGRHNRGYGFLSDMEKANELALQGWTLLRFTPRQVETGEAIGIIKAWFKNMEVLSR